MNQEEQEKIVSQIIAKCWADAAFKQRLLADPAATLLAEGVVLPTGLSVKVVENTDTVFHFVLPAAPTDLSDEDLDAVAAGAYCVPRCLATVCGQYFGSLLSKNPDSRQPVDLSPVKRLA